MRLPFKHAFIGRTLFGCRTILQSWSRIALKSLLALSMVSCGPGGGDTINQYLTNQGADKKLPDDDGYTGSGGTGDGGGGQGIACSANTKNPSFQSKIFVRDIFEAIYNSKLAIKSLSSSPPAGNDQVSDEAISLLIESLRGYFGPATTKLEVGKREFWRKFIEKISFVSDDATLYPSQDANSPIALPHGCRIVQIAFWQDSDGRSDNGILYVDKKQWSQLDQVNKIALLAHEYFFKEARKAGYKNSDFVRSKVGRLLSTEGLSPLFENWEPAVNPLTRNQFPKSIEGFKYCRGTSESDPSAILHMYQYKGKDGKQHFTFPSLKSTTITISSLQGREFTPSSGNAPLEDLTNYLLVSSDKNWDELKSFVIDEKFRFFEAKYAGSGINILTEPPEAVLATEITNLKDYKKSILWAGLLPTAQGTIQLNLENPQFDPAGLKVWSDEEKTKLLRRKLYESVAEKPDHEAWIGNKDKFIKALTILDKEIGEVRNSGEFTGNFPKWEAALDEYLTAAFQDQYDPMGTERGLISSEASSLALLLYRSYFSALTKDDLYLAGIGDLTGWENAPPPKGKVSVKFMEKFLTFDLDCSSYDQEYFRLISEHPRSQPETSRLKSIVVNPAKMSPDESRYFATLGAYLADRRKELNESLRLQCKSGVDDSELRCGHSEFAQRLSKGGGFNISSCLTRSERHIQLETSAYQDISCMIVGFPEDASYFIVYSRIPKLYSDWDGMAFPFVLPIGPL